MQRGKKTINPFRVIWPKHTTLYITMTKSISSEEWVEDAWEMQHWQGSANAGVNNVVSTKTMHYITVNGVETVAERLDVNNKAEVPVTKGHPANSITEFYYFIGQLFVRNLKLLIFQDIKRKLILDDLHTPKTMQHAFCLVTQYTELFLLPHPSHGFIRVGTTRLSRYHQQPQDLVSLPLDVCWSLKNLPKICCLMV